MRVWAPKTCLKLPIPSRCLYVVAATPAAISAGAGPVGAGDRGGRADAPGSVPRAAGWVRGERGERGRDVPSPRPASGRNQPLAAAVQPPSWPALPRPALTRPSPLPHCSRRLRRRLPAGAGHRREGAQAQRLPPADRGGWVGAGCVRCTLVDAFCSQGSWLRPLLATPGCLLNAAALPPLLAPPLLAPAALLGPAAGVGAGLQLPDGAGSHHDRHADRHAAGTAPRAAHPGAAAAGDAAAARPARLVCGAGADAEPWQGAAEGRQGGRQGAGGPPGSAAQWLCSCV